MILIVHIIFGAAIGSLLSQNAPLAITLAFLSHYFLDMIPHVEYPIKNGDHKQWRKMKFKFLRIIIDFLLGILLILILSPDKPLVFICGIITIIPDGFTVLRYLFPGNKFFNGHHKFHQKIHLFEDKNYYKPTRLNQIKISSYWRVMTQVIVVIISVVLFKIYPN